MKSRNRRCSPTCLVAKLSTIQRARLMDDQGEELTAGLARLELGTPLSVTLVDIEPIAPLARAVARGRREYQLELVEGMTLQARVVGSGGTVGRHRVCFLQVLSAPVPCYCVGSEWHEIRA